jgi:putative ABC transport system ATP-binding protein
MTSFQPELAVRCHGVFKTDGTGAASVPALRGVDLNVSLGELLMLVGPSGCGKTTLISIVAAILDPDQGECEVLGHDIFHMDQKNKVRTRLTFVMVTAQDGVSPQVLAARAFTRIPVCGHALPRILQPTPCVGTWSIQRTWEI